MDISLTETMPITMSKIALDTNILLYGVSVDDERKRKISCKLIDRQPVIFPQNLSEFINVLLNRWKYPKHNIEIAIKEILSDCLLEPTSPDTYLNAFELVKKYDFQIFDAIIVSSALASGCEILYTEDMQHGLLVEKQLTIINPFLV
jgi:predicted nucleic acid-binding protein